MQKRAALTFDDCGWVVARGSEREGSNQSIETIVRRRGIGHRRGGKDAGRRRTRRGRYRTRDRAGGSGSAGRFYIADQIEIVLIVVVAIAVTGVILRRDVSVGDQVAVLVARGIEAPRVPAGS